MMRLSCLTLAMTALLSGPGQAQTTLSLPLDGATLDDITYFCDGGALVQVSYLDAGPNSLALLPIDEWWAKGRNASLTNATDDAATRSCVQTD